MHAQIDERAERGDIGNRAFELHARFELLDIVHTDEQLGRAEFGARIAAGFFQLGQHIAHGERAEAVVHELLGAQALQRIAIAHQQADRLACRSQHLFHQRIALRMHAGAIQRVVAAVDAQKTCGLLEGFVAQAAHRLECLAVGESAGLVAVQHDLLGNARAQAGHAGQQRRRGGVQVDADGVHTVFDDGIELARQRGLVHVMLILADADALGVDLHQFGQRVLHPAGDGHRAAQAHVQIGKLAAGQTAGRIHRGAGLAHRELGQAGLVGVAQQFGGEQIGFAAGGAVANGDELHAVALHQRRQGGECALHVAPRLEGVNRGGIEQFSGSVDHGDFHPGTNAGVESHDHLRPGRGGQQQIAQIGTEYIDGHRLGLFAQARQQLAFQREGEFDLPGPLYRAAQPVVCGAALMAPAQQHGKTPLGQGSQRRCDRAFGHWRQVDAGIEHLLRPPAQHGQGAVRRHFVQRLGVVEIVAEFGAFLLFSGAQLADQVAGLPQPFTHRGDHRRGFGPAFTQNVAGAVEARLRGGGICRLGAVLRADEPSRRLQRIGLRLQPKQIGQRLQPGLAGFLRPSDAARLVGQIKVFEFLLLPSRADGGLQFGRELALLGDGLQHHGAAVFEFAQIEQALFQRAQMVVAHAARHLFAIAGNEGHRSPAIHQFDGRLNLLRRELQFGAERLQHPPSGGLRVGIRILGSGIGSGHDGSEDRQKPSSLTSPDPLRHGLQRVHRQLEIADPVGFGFRHFTGAHIDLHRGQDERGHVQRGVALFAESDELLLGGLGIELDIALTLGLHRGLPDGVAAAGHVVVAKVELGLRRQAVELVHRLVKHMRVSAREVAARRAVVGHEQSIADKGAVAHEISDAGGRVAGGMHHPGLQLANGKGLTVLEQMIEGRTVGGHGAVVEHLAEHFLHVLNVFANRDLAAEQLFEIGRGGEMVGMGMAFQQPVHREPLLAHVGGDLVGKVGFGATRGVIEVEHAVENCAVASFGVDDAMGRRKGGRVKPALNGGGLRTHTGIS